MSCLLVQTSLGSVIKRTHDELYKVSGTSFIQKMCIWQRSQDSLYHMTF